MKITNDNEDINELKIKINSDLPSLNHLGLNHFIKYLIYFSTTIDDIKECKKITSDLFADTGTHIKTLEQIKLGKDNLYKIIIYIVKKQSKECKSNAYRYEFLIKRDESELNICISRGIKRPIVKVNDNSAANFESAVDYQSCYGAPSAEDTIFNLDAKMYYSDRDPCVIF